MSKKLVCELEVAKVTKSKNRMFVQFKNGSGFWMESKHEKPTTGEKVRI